MSSYSSVLNRFGFTLFLALVWSAGLAAQRRPGGGTTGSAPTGSSPVTNPQSRPTGDFPSIMMPSPTFLTGKVAVSDGTPLTESVVIQSVCSGMLRNEGRTDFKGNFSFEVNGASNVGDAQADAEVSGSGFGSQLGRPGKARDLSRCELQASLPGFSSQTLNLAGKLDGAGSANVGTIVLSRMEKVDGFSISVTSLAAPDKARKVYEKGREDAKKEKWDAAGEKLSKAVEIYPKYAVAWLELGEVQLHQHDSASAKASFHRALDADPKFTTPYDQLARLAVQEKQWNDAVQVTDQLLKLNPLSYPQAWFYNSLGNYFLQSFGPAEKAAQQGIAVDLQHQVPRLEYLMAMILIQKRDYQGAIAHMRSYTRLAPKATDLDAAQKQIAELEKAAAPPPSQAK
jgi:tetratricopeptide (TPR) repeat protein